MSGNYHRLASASAGLPPPGSAPDFVDSEASHQVYIILGVFFTLMLIAVSIRLYTRIRLIKSWWWDDYTCIIAATGSLIHTVLYITIQEISSARQKLDMSTSSHPKDMNTQFSAANGVTYLFTIFFTKISILLLYLRLFSIHRPMMIAVYTIIIGVTLFYVSIIGIEIGFLVECNTVQRSIQHQLCHSFGSVVLLSAIVNTATDFGILFLPVHPILNLQQRLRRKLAILAVFAGGLGACAASLARLVELSIGHNDVDRVWVQGINAEFSIVEVNVGIIVACANSFPTFFKYIASRLKVNKASPKALSYSHLNDPC